MQINAQIYWYEKAGFWVCEWTAEKLPFSVALPWHFKLGNVNGWESGHRQGIDQLYKGRTISWSNRLGGGRKTSVFAQS